VDKENPGLDLERYDLAMQAKAVTRGKLFALFILIFNPKIFWGENVSPVLV
jgi:hypothetical protein